jgi:hypothetical protein
VASRMRPPRTRRGRPAAAPARGRPAQRRRQRLRGRAVVHRGDCACVRRKDGAPTRRIAARRNAPEHSMCMCTARRGTARHSAAQRGTARRSAAQRSAAPAARLCCHVPPTCPCPRACACVCACVCASQLKLHCDVPHKALLFDSQAPTPPQRSSSRYGVALRPGSGLRVPHTRPNPPHSRTLSHAVFRSLRRPLLPSEAAGRALPQALERAVVGRVGRVWGAYASRAMRLAALLGTCGVCQKKGRVWDFFSRVLALTVSFACVHGPFRTPLSPLVCVPYGTAP